MSEKPDVPTCWAVRISFVVTQCALVTPLILTWIKLTTGLPAAWFALILAAWMAGVLVWVTFRCASRIQRRIDEQNIVLLGQLDLVGEREARVMKRLKELQASVDELIRLQARQARETSIAAALDDDNITSINERR